MGLTINRSNCPGCENANISEVLTCSDYTVSKEEFAIWECAHCRLRFTQAAPAQEAIGPYYQSEDYISHSDTAKGLVNRLYKIARNYTLNWKIKLVQEQAGGPSKRGSLLDIGAGTGAFLARAASAKWSVTGLEPDEGARKLCLEKYGLQTESPTALFSLPTAQYDAITMWHVLEHVHKLQEYMSEIKRVMKPQGTALIALPNYTSLDAEIYGQFWAAYDVPRHLYHFSPLSVRQLAGRHGLAVTGTRPMWLDSIYISMLSEKYRYGKGNMSRAVKNGLRSNLMARQQQEACSSLVYLLKHA